MQKAYGILDKYKLSRTFFVKTDQNSCEIAEAQQTQQQQQQPAHGNEAPQAPAAPTQIQNDAATANGSKKPGKKGTQIQKKGAQTSGREEGVSESEPVVNVKEKEKEKESVVPVHKEHEPVVASDQKVEITIPV